MFGTALTHAMFGSAQSPTGDSTALAMPAMHIRAVNCSVAILFVGLTCRLRV